MHLKDYIQSGQRGTSTDLCKLMGISLPHLWQLANGKSSISPARAVQIEKLTAGVVSRQDLRPNDWQSIWPELVNNE